MKKTLTVFILTLAFVLAFAASSSAAFLGTGGGVIAGEVELIKTSLSGEPINFSDTDFKAALALTDLKKITILSLPEESEGTLTLSGKRVSSGQTVKRRALSELSFTPKDSEVLESSFTFLVNGTSEEEILCSMKFIDNINYAPKIAKSTESTLSVITQSGISVYGRIEGSDPEGDEVDYIIVSSPRYGYVTITDKELGEFKYTPTANFSGKDSFTVVARDSYGNFSHPESITVKIIERMSEVVFSDMGESKSYNAAIAMCAMGIMSGEVVGDETHFSPSEGVTRAEFVAMALKTRSIRPDSTESATFFDDNDDIPKALVGYVATAARCGIVNGAFENGELRFRPNDIITHYEAAVVMANLINYTGEIGVSYEKDASVPVWARESVSAMQFLGIFDKTGALNMTEKVSREAAAEYLYKLSSV